MRGANGGRGPARSAMLAAVSLLLAGCDSLTGPDRTRTLGTILHEDGEPAVTVPDTVEAGEPFTVSVVTFWTNGCASLDETEVRATASEVHVIPWDLVGDPSDETTCDTSAPTFDHSVTLSRATPAVLTLTVHGRRLEDGGERVEIGVTREVVVRAP